MTALATPSKSPSHVTVESLPAIVYKGQPVITTDHLAQVYGVQPKLVRDNFQNNRDRFAEGKHFFKLENGELKAFRDCTENFGSVVPARTRNLLLWTARGSARHAKMLNTDTAWDVFEKLEDSFFSQAHPSPTGHLSPDQQQHIRNLVAARAKALPHGGGFPQIWERVKNRFGVARYQDIPASQFEAVVEYLLKMELKASESKALPPARTSSTVRDYAAIYKDLPSDASRWKDLKSRLFQASNAYGRELAAIRELAREPFRMSRKSDIATLFDSVLDPIDTLFQAAESSEHAVFCHVNAALNGYMAAHEFLTRG